MKRRLAVLAIALVSCGDRRKVDVENQRAALGGEIAARVGTETVPVALVAKVAGAQKVTPDEALHRILDDAIAAESAKAHGLDKTVPASWLLVAARARFTADRLTADARAKGPPTDDEVKQLSQRHWREVDRPPSVRVQHALVMKPTKDAEIPAAKALAAAIHDAVVAAPSGDPFRTAALAVPHDKDLEVRVEDLPPFIDDGQIVDQPGAMVESFAKAAFAIAKPGETSGIVETSFGWHVIRLVERLPEQRMPFEQRRAAFQDEVIATRAFESLEQRLEALRGTAPISVASNAEQLMRGVRVSEP